MKIFHLDIKDESDPRFDVNVFYTHSDESKTYRDLENDYVKAYENVFESDRYDWTLEDILEKIDSYGWNQINVETAKVRY
jgi:hypothetical protein